MSKQVIITVTKSDIMRGEAGRSRWCPIALAMRRRFKESIVVRTTFALAGDAFIPLPDKAAQFIRTFDRTGTGKPFRFTVKR